ncbi:hypothetical protein SESBI_14954 [Sesbania bispinosa]|nr:hypothetical protein SESBI_14954 [Sesbania bispinosa]
MVASFILHLLPNLSTVVPPVHLRHLCLLPSFRHRHLWRSIILSCVASVIEGHRHLCLMCSFVASCTASPGRRVLLSSFHHRATPPSPFHRQAPPSHATVKNAKQGNI